ncbi:hypothetical protein QQF64_035952 [Cirrhinus molitorella]|uniref:Uncharacterized protein n=1 Tax=Cirrhinus molitorella TaxID=172907 RepID=A0ABR3NH85_9TELE
MELQWQQRDLDCFQVYVKLQRRCYCRGILSTVASIYDPLGFIAPILLKGKGILQEACKRGIGWDDSLSKELQLRWEQWKQNLYDLHRINIPRMYVLRPLGEH